MLIDLTDVLSISAVSIPIGLFLCSGVAACRRYLARTGLLEHPLIRFWSSWASAVGWAFAAVFVFDCLEPVLHLSTWCRMPLGLSDIGGKMAIFIAIVACVVCLNTHDSSDRSSTSS
jgi:hypothetical protein